MTRWPSKAEKKKRDEKIMELLNEGYRVKYVASQFHLSEGYTQTMVTKCSKRPPVRDLRG